MIHTGCARDSRTGDSVEVAASVKEVMASGRHGFCLCKRWKWALLQVC